MKCYREYLGWNGERYFCQREKLHDGECMGIMRHVPDPEKGDRRSGVIHCRSEALETLRFAIMDVARDVHGEGEDAVLGRALDALSDYQRAIADHELLLMETYERAVADKLAEFQADHERRVGNTLREARKGAAELFARLTGEEDPPSDA